MAVRCLKNIMVVVLALLWLPASSHALLEYAGLIHERHADHADHADHDTDSSGSHEHDTENHEAADGNYASPSPHISVPMPDAVAMPMLFCALRWNWVSELHVAPPPSGLAPPGTAPPQFSHNWQFSFRTALPARAPSLIS
jgi:hypothetical protein